MISKSGAGLASKLKKTMTKQTEMKLSVEKSPR